MTNLGKLIFLLLILAVAGSLFLFFKTPKFAEEKNTITSFEECKDAGYPIMESYPEQCRDGAGNLFVQEIDDTIPPPVIDSNTDEFGKAITVKIGETINFSDGSISPFMGPTLSLKEINDSRCKPGVQCIWAGELSALFMFSESATSSKLDELRLGTVNNKSITRGDYNYFGECY